MLRALRTLIERQIFKARAEGQLQKLRGEGHPLPDRPGDAFVDPGLAAGYRIMAEAGVRPEEFDLKDQLIAARKEYQELTSPDDKRRKMAEIADLEMRYNIARDARKRFMR